MAHGVNVLNGSARINPYSRIRSMCLPIFPVLIYRIV